MVSRFAVASAAVLGMLTLMSAAAMATTITYTDTLPAVDVPLGGTVTGTIPVTPFNTSAGTLEDTTVSIATTFDVGGSATATAPVPPTPSLIQLTGTTATYDLANYGLAQTPITSAIATLADCQFGCGKGTYGGTGLITKTGSQSSSPTAPPLPGGDIPYKFTFSNVAPSPWSVALTNAVGAKVTVTDTYAPLPPPTIDVTVALGGQDRSTTGDATTIIATATPANGLTLQEAATALGYPLGLDWVQTVTSFPSPSPPLLLQVSNPIPLTAPPNFNDPPPSGYVNGKGVGNYPFYYDPNPSYITSVLIPLPDGTQVPAETVNTLNLVDSPADPCLPGGSAALCGATPATSGELAYTDELVGVVSCTPGVGKCNSAGRGPSASIPFIYDGAPASEINWTDTFNGTSGGIPALSNLQPVDPDSGSGGINVLSNSVPEPSTLVLLLSALLGIIVSPLDRKRIRK
jgi:hypothetical protein